MSTISSIVVLAVPVGILTNFQLWGMGDEGMDIGEAVLLMCYWSRGNGERLE